MTTPEFPELEKLQTSMDVETAGQQQRSVRAAIVTAGPVDARRWWAHSGRWLAGLVVGLGVLAPATAFAADSAQPGDLLYPVKKAVEPILGWFDDDVAAQHRVEELEEVVNDTSRTDEIDEGLVRDAVDAVAETDSPELNVRLGEVLDTIDDGTDVDRPLPEGDSIDDRPAADERPTAVPTVRPTPLPVRPEVNDGPRPGDVEPTTVPTQVPVRPPPVRDVPPQPSATAIPVPTDAPEPTPVVRTNDEQQPTDRTRQND